MRGVDSEHDPARAGHGERCADRRRRHRRRPAGRPLQRLRAGQLVTVLVVVKSPSDRSFVAVVDPIPAGLEAVNTKLATSQHAPRRYSGYGYRHGRRWKYGWTHTELRDDRVLGFADRMRAGELVMEYLARATISGTFQAGPTTAEEMYTPAVNGRSAVMRRILVGRDGGGLVQREIATVGRRFGITLQRLVGGEQV